MFPGQGGIYVIMGPMYSGKSGQLLKRHRETGIKGKKCISISFAHDTRYANSEQCIVTHCGIEEKSLPASTLKEVFFKPIICITNSPPNLQSSDLPLGLTNLFETAQEIFVDEGQFFPDLAEMCEFAAKNGKIVHVACLSSTYKRTSFDTVSALLPLADRIKFLYAVCEDCGAKAAFTKRTTSETELLVIGQKDKYKACCRSCHSMDTVK